MLDFPQAKKADGNVAVRVHASSRQKVMMTGETGAYTYMSPEVLLATLSWPIPSPHRTVVPCKACSK